ncbi:hypothetical protein A2U01_0115949, partial [Trifolium medium]|nr:hypothetical protein [Trifolium medium]
MVSGAIRCRLFPTTLRKWAMAWKEMGHGLTPPICLLVEGFDRAILQTFHRL